MTSSVRFCQRANPLRSFGTCAVQRSKESADSWEGAPDVMTVSQAASLLQMDEKAVYVAIHAGLIPAKNFGERQWRISKKALAKVFGIEAEYQNRDRRLQPSEA